MIQSIGIRNGSSSRIRDAIRLVCTFWGMSGIIVAQNTTAPNDELVLSERIMNLAVTSAELSVLSYDVNPPTTGYKRLVVLDAEPDQALVAEKDGYCFAVFRGTTFTFDDWMENLEVGTAQVNTTSSESCMVRIGYWQAYNTIYKSQLEKAVRDCAKNCVDKDNCVVLTGHSQGGAVAAVAAIALADLNPMVFTFGQPATVIPPCNVITSTRWYRFVNTKASKAGAVGIVYDPVPFTPGLGAKFWGYMILLSSEDDTGVAYIGLDVQNFFGPLNYLGFQAHSIIKALGSDYPGYLDRLLAITNHTLTESETLYPIRDNGFKAGSLCTENIECETEQCARETGFTYKRCVGVDCKVDSDCDTGRCDSGICLPKLGSCDPCDEDSDCEYGVCGWNFRCSDATGKMANECTCIVNDDCTTGRCDGFTTRYCEPLLADGSYCDESSDCISGSCSWRFRCNPTPASPATLLTADLVLTKSSNPQTSAVMISGMNMLVGTMLACFLLFLTANHAYYYYQGHRRREHYEAIPTLALQT